MNNAQRIDIEFIKRCEEFAKPYVEENIETCRERNRRWRINNPEKFKESQRKFLKKESVRLLLKTRWRLVRHSRMNLHQEEWNAIGSFYLNVPDGYVVDHIIPISKGGKHVLSNLQYLTVEDNSSKGCKLDWKKIK